MLHAPTELRVRIESCLNHNGEVKDDASTRLKELRRRLQQLRGRIHEKLEGLLRRKELFDAFQEEVVTQRNNRYVVLVRADCKGKVKGIVHDVSQSGMSLYIEPLGIVDANNELNLVLTQEREEEELILRSLSNVVRAHTDTLLDCMLTQGRLDVIAAKARLSEHLAGVEPAISQQGRVKLQSARHPLLTHRYSTSNDKQVVPVSVCLDDTSKILIISGANTGGKTVALKTLGLLSLMAQAGLHIPCDRDSEIPVFRQIHAYIGDEQDVSEDLSTFSSFIVWLNDIAKDVTEEALILIDEIGVGTEYSHGAALAMGLLDYLRERKAYAAVTTHFNDLKSYAFHHEGVTNVAVEFDEATLKPTYRLLYGVPGTSHTYLIAERLGLNEQIMRRAKAHENTVRNETDELIEELASLTTVLHREREEVGRLKRELLKEQEALRAASFELADRKKDVLRETKEEGRRIINSLRARLYQVLAKTEEGGYDPAQIKGDFKRAVNDHFIRPVHQPQIPRDYDAIAVGDHVEIGSLGKQGFVVDVLPTHQRVRVSVEGMRVTAGLDDLKLIADGPGERREQGLGVQLDRPAAPDTAFRDLNVIGLRVGDALPKVDKFLDDAILQGWNEVQIIHGLGTGRLREAIQEFLRQHRAVRGFRGGEVTEGGGGITVVELR